MHGVHGGEGVLEDQLDLARVVQAALGAQGDDLPVERELARGRRDDARAAVKQHIGYLSQNFTLYGDLTIDENIEFFAELHGA